MTTATRSPYLRRITSDKESNSMNLPDGKTCGDCAHCSRCCAIFGHIPEDQRCDFYPSRFMPSQAAPTTGEG